MFRLCSKASTLSTPCFADVNSEIAEKCGGDKVPTCEVGDDVLRYSLLTTVAEIYYVTYYSESFG